MIKKQKIIIAVTGASGAIYTKVLFDKLVELQEQVDDVGIIMSNNAQFVWKQEIKDMNYINYMLKLLYTADNTKTYYNIFKLLYTNDIEL